MLSFERPQVAGLEKALKTQSKVMHILVGPRQVGKSTLARAIAARWKGPVVSASADQALPPESDWIHAHFEQALSQANVKKPALLVLDEVQKVKDWAEVVKARWDALAGQPPVLTVLLLGSSALQVQRGLSESLAGRFFLHRLGHWPWQEMQAAFGLSLDAWIYYGGYPGSMPFRKNAGQWPAYISDSLIEAVLARDVLQMQTVAKPALLRHLFALSAAYPAQVLSYNKMLGQLQDAGNTTTLAHYLDLLASAFLITGLQAYSGTQVRRRASSPKLIVWNNALINALSGLDFKAARADRSWWGRLVENAVGAHLLNHLPPATHQVMYWRKGNAEVDFVVRTPRKLWALEVKSGRSAKTPGLAAFMKSHPQAKALLLGENGVSLQDFFSNNPTSLLD